MIKWEISGKKEWVYWWLDGLLSSWMGWLAAVKRVFENKSVQGLFFFCR